MKKILVLIFLLLIVGFISAASENSTTNAVKANSNTVNSAQVQERNLGNGSQVQNQEGVSEYRARIIQRVQNRLRANTEVGNCPEDCTCEGATTRCQYQNREMIIRAGNSNNTIIQVKEQQVRTRVELYKAEGKIYGKFRNNETRPIEILPDQAREQIQERLRLKNCSCDIELDEDGKYQIKAQKRARLFGFIPVRERVEMQMNSETGELVQTRASWWGFLAKDVVEDAEQ